MARVTLSVSIEVYYVPAVACGRVTTSCGCRHSAMPRPAEITAKTSSCPKGVSSGLTGETKKKKKNAGRKEKRKKRY